MNSNSNNSNTNPTNNTNPLIDASNKPAVPPAAPATHQLVDSSKPAICLAFPSTLSPPMSPLIPEFLHNSIMTNTNSSTSTIASSTPSASIKISKKPSHHKLRSRSLPNLFYNNTTQSLSITNTIHHHHHHANPYRQRKHVNTQKKGSLVFSRTSSPLLLHSTPFLPATSPAPFVYDLSMPIELMPPVNTTSLKEIDLQEIFKNPQLRHDIVFDPQLQFRPNLDGERGKCKRASTEKYWETIVSELAVIAKNSNSSLSPFMALPASSKLPYLFLSMRDILDSLLPAKDREAVDSILDPELLLRQLQHCALDFVALAQWLSSVFKAHCAPMRDTWVDQMVSRIESGVTTQSPRRIVEGLRMIFAILEAMKLDVANHQIRTLRPVLVDTAIEFEQGYYSQIIEKGKFNLEDSLVWYNKNLVKTKDLNKTTNESHRYAFCMGLVNLLSCASDDLVTEFPSTFGFDYTRLADFRAEVRQIVCMHLCVTLFQQLVSGQLSKMTTVPVLEKRGMMNSAMGACDELKQAVVAIIADAYGNTKWTKNTSTVALEIAKRVEKITKKEPSVIPESGLIDMATSWLSKHLQPRSPIYKLIEGKVTKSLAEICARSMNELANLEQTPSLSNAFTCSEADAGQQQSKTSVEVAWKKEIETLVSKVLVLIRFHWGVFGHYYVASSNTTEEASERPSATGMAMASKSGASSQQQQRLQQHSKNDDSKPNASTGSSSADNKITQSL